MVMRIRVATLPPLPITKVWASLGDLPSAATINDLKLSLCNQIPALKGLKSNQIQLSVDDFELLEASLIDIVHKNDTVHIKRVDSGIPAPDPPDEGGAAMLSELLAIFKPNLPKEEGGGDYDDEEAAIQRAIAESMQKEVRVGRGRDDNDEDDIQRAIATSMHERGKEKDGGDDGKGEATQRSVAMSTQEEGKEEDKS